MLKALVNETMCRASPGGRAKCPNCGKELIAKCGEFKTWHWAHESKIDCGYEPETATLLDRTTIQIKYNGYNESKFLKELRKFRGIHYTE